MLRELQVFSTPYYYVVDPDNSANNFENMRLWRGAVTNMAAESRRLEVLSRKPGTPERPIVAWMSPIFEDRVGHNHRYVSRQVWRDSLEHLYNLNIHILLWHGWDPVAGRVMQWPPRDADGQISGWWLETVDFLRSKGIAPANATP